MLMEDIYFSTYIAWTEIWIIDTQLILELIVEAYYQYTVYINRCKQAGNQNAENETTYGKDMCKLQL